MMKKGFLLFNLFPLMSALSLLSCGTNEQTDVFYKISYESSNLYTILNLPETAMVRCFALILPLLRQMQTHISNGMFLPFPEGIHFPALSG